MLFALFYQFYTKNIFDVDHVARPSRRISSRMRLFCLLLFQGDVEIFWVLGLDF